MRASEYIQHAANDRLGIPAQVGQFPTPFDPGNGAIRYLLAGSDRLSVIDGPSDPIIRYYEVQCAAPTPDGARQIADDLLGELRPHLIEVFGRYDHSAHSQQVGGYYSHVMNLALPGTIAP